MFGRGGKKGEETELPEVPEAAANLLEPRFCAAAGGLTAATHVHYNSDLGALALAGVHICNLVPSQFFTRETSGQPRWDSPSEILTALTN